MSSGIILHRWPGHDPWDYWGLCFQLSAPEAFAGAEQQPPPRDGNCTFPEHLEVVPAKEAREMARELFALLETNVLIRNTARDAEFSHFFQDGLRIVRMLQKAHAIAEFQ